MNLTNPETLILLMLSEIHEHLKIENGIDSKFVQKVICNGSTWALSWKYDSILPNREKTPPIVSEVLEILNMWDRIESSYDDLSPEDRALVEGEAKPFGDAKFRGFDGNAECDQIGVARCFIEDFDSCPRFKGRDLNSHLWGSLDNYRRMLQVYRPILAEITNGNLSATQLASVLKAARASR